MPNSLPTITIPPATTVEDLRRSLEIILNQQVQDVATAQSRLTQTLDVNGNTVTGLPDPSNPLDAVNLRTLKNLMGSGGSNSPSTASPISSFRVNPRKGTVSGLHAQNAGVGDTPKFLKVGAGTQAAAPAYPIDIRVGSTTAGLHLCDTDADKGTYILNSGNYTFLSNGASYNGSNWIAKDTAANILQVSGTAFVIYYNSGLTPGSIFTPTQIALIDSSGNVVVSGNVSGGGTSLSALLASVGSLSSGKAAHGTYSVTGGGGGSVTI